MRRHGPVIAHCTDSEDFPLGPHKSSIRTSVAYMSPTVSITV